MSAVKDDLLNNIVAAYSVDGAKTTKAEAERFLSATLSAIVTTVQEKESIRTPIGTFSWKNVEARARINPRTGTPVDVPAYATLKFKTSKTLRTLAEDAKPATKKTATKAAPAKVAAKPAVKVAAAPAKKVIAKKK